MRCGRRIGVQMARHHLGVLQAYLPDQVGWVLAADIEERSDTECSTPAATATACSQPHDLDRISFEGHAMAAAPIHPQLRGVSHFGAAMTRLAAPFLLVAQASPDTFLYRCESLTRAALGMAIDAGPGRSNVLKSAAGCGMFPCGDRFSGDSTAALIARCPNRPHHERRRPDDRQPARALNPHGRADGRFPTFQTVIPRAGPAMVVCLHLLIVGGGNIGSAAAIQSANVGMRVVLMNGGDLGAGATASQTREVDADALASHALWEQAGDKIGYKVCSGFTLAVTDREA